MRLNKQVLTWLPEKYFISVCRHSGRSVWIALEIQRHKSAMKLSGINQDIPDSHHDLKKRRNLKDHQFEEVRENQTKSKIKFRTRNYLTSNPQNEAIQGHQVKIFKKDRCIHILLKYYNESK